MKLHFHVSQLIISLQLDTKGNEEDIERALQNHLFQCYNIVILRGRGLNSWQRERREIAPTSPSDVVPVVPCRDSAPARRSGEEDLIVSYRDC